MSCATSLSNRSSRHTSRSPARRTAAGREPDGRPANRLRLGYGGPPKLHAKAEAGGYASLTVTVLERGGGARAGAGLGRWLARVAPRGAHGQVTVAIEPDRTVRTLNRRFRGKDRPTDVLSFPAIGRPRGAEARPPHPRAGEGGWLGDIVIARGVARAQAREGGHSMAVEMRILALHGLLHLLGYDHETDDGRMARVERRLRHLGGLPVGKRGQTPFFRPRRINSAKNGV